MDDSDDRTQARLMMEQALGELDVENMLEELEEEQSLSSLSSGNLDDIDVDEQELEQEEEEEEEEQDQEQNQAQDPDQSVSSISKSMDFQQFEKLTSMYSEGEDDEDDGVRIDPPKSVTEQESATHALEDWERFPHPPSTTNKQQQDVDEDVAAIEEDQEKLMKTMEELIVASQRLVLPDDKIFQSKQQQPQKQKHAEEVPEPATSDMELEGTSCMVRIELDISKLFFEKETKEEVVVLEQEQETKKNGNVELEFLRARCRALENKIQLLTTQSDENVQKENEERVHMLDDMEGLITEKGKLVAHLEQKLQETTDELFSARKTIDDLLHGEEESSRALQETRNADQVKIQQLETDLQELSRIHQDMEQETTHMRTVIEKQESTIESLQSELSQTLETKKRLEAQVQQLDWTMTKQGNTPRASGGHPIPKENRWDEGNSWQPSSLPSSPKNSSPRNYQQQQLRPPAISVSSSYSSAPPVRRNSIASVPDLSAYISQQREIQAQEEQILDKLRNERRRLKEAQSRIKRANYESTKSLELAISELRSLEMARQQAEQQAAESENQVEKTRRDMERLQTIADSPMPLPSFQHRMTPPQPKQQQYPSIIPQHTTEPYQVVEPAPPPLQQEYHRYYEQQENETQPAQPSFEHSQQQDQPRDGTTPGKPAAMMNQRAMVNQSQWSFEDMFSLANEQEENYQKQRRRSETGRPPKIPIENISPTNNNNSLRGQQRTPGVGPGQNQADWASSRESLAPFATESSTRDLQNGFSLLERKLMMINLEREKREAEFNRLVNKGVKTKAALDEKMYLENRLKELHQEASNVRVALKRQPK